MGLFGRKKPKPETMARKAPISANPAPPAAPSERKETLEITHPVFQLKTGMDKNAVTTLLGDDYLSMGSGQLLDHLARSGPVHIMDDASEPTLCLLYSNDPKGHSIEIVLDSGALTSAEVKKKNADGSTTLLVRIDRKGLAAAEPYRAALGLKGL
jgi:hypothetical protein